MLAILFQEKTKKKGRFPKSAEKNASIIEKGLTVTVTRNFASQYISLTSSHLNI